MNNERDALIGTQIGAYQIQSLLGEGGMARVYKAYHPRLRREAAMKIILAEVAAREGFQERFELEAQISANLQHPNIVSIYDSGRQGNLTYLAMQYVGGGTLREQLDSGRPLPIGLAVSYAIQMARALHHAHIHGVVHRDVKPQNMLVSATDRTQLLLSDFGIAKLYTMIESPTAFTEMPTRSIHQQDGLTRVDQVVGTAEYLSPEQINGGQIDGRTDVYALGIVLYQMLSGEIPFHSETLQGMLFQQVYSPAPPIRTKNPAVPESLAAIISQAMAKVPSDRFQTAEAMALALEQARAEASSPRAVSSYPTIIPGQEPTVAAWSNDSRSLSYLPQSQGANRTFASDLTAPDRTVAAPPGSSSFPTMHPGLTRSNANEARGRRPPLSYLMMAGVLIIGLVVLGLHIFGLPSRSTPSTSNTGTTSNANSGTGSHTSTASPFLEQFQSANKLNWSTGQFAQGVTAELSNGQYTIETTQQGTAFPFPAAVGNLPANFTLTASMAEQAGDASTLSYGLTVRFTAQNGVAEDGYALVITNSGAYGILEIGHGHTLANPLWQGTYTGGSGQHTLKIQARDSTYTFFVDQHQLSTGINQSSLHNADITTGSLALLVTGPGGTFIITQVQLTIP
jgi:serine/threonine protein kinase